MFKPSFSTLAVALCVQSSNALFALATPNPINGSCECNSPELSLFLYSLALADIILRDPSIWYNEDVQVWSGTASSGLELFTFAIEILRILDGQQHLDLHVFCSDRVGSLDIACSVYAAKGMILSDRGTRLAPLCPTARASTWVTASAPCGRQTSTVLTSLSPSI